MRTPAAFVAIPTLIGSVAGLLLWDRVPDQFALATAVAALLALLAAAASLGTGAMAESAVAIGAGCVLAGASLAASSAAAVYQPPLLRWFDARSAADSSDPVVLDGVLKEDAAQTRFGPSLTLDVRRLDGVRLQPDHGPDADRDTSLGGVRLSVAGEMTATRIGEWRAGRRIRVAATLRLPAVYLNPGLRDERAALARREIVLVGSVKSGALVEVLARGSSTSEAAASIRAWTRKHLGAAVGRWSPRSAGIAAAILIGDRTGLTEEESRRLQDAGTYHVIAISGGNIAILTTLLLGTFHLARLPTRAAAGLTILLLVFYGRIAAPAPSVDRAIAASIVYLTGRLLDQRGPAFNVLAVAALIGAATVPVTIFDPGFLLSFGATLGILIALQVAPQSRGACTVMRRAARAAGLLLTTTCGAEIAVGPISASMFSRVTFAGLVLNFAAIPLMSVVQTASLAVLLTSPIEPVATVCGFVAHVAAAGLVESARFVELTPWLVRSVVAPAWWLIAVYYGSIVLALRLTGRRAVRIAVTVAVAAGGLIVGSQRWTMAGGPPARSVALRMVFLDVGQGDSTAVLLPGRRSLLVDAGGLATAIPVDSTDVGGSGFDVGERVIAPALRALGIWRLDTLVLTHGDPDHIGGATSVIRRFFPASVWEGVPVPPHPGLRALERSALSAGARWRTVQAGDAERIGDVTVRVLHPPLPDWERQRVRNEDSVVLEIRFGDVRVILPGDIGREGEQAVLPFVAPAGITVLKAPHHGSATSSTPAFLSALDPDVVIFSAGRANRFGHPHPAVVARYRERGTRMLSTAEDGAVILDTDGKRVWLSGRTGRVLELTSPLDHP
jgi:competence protein ComEC